MPTARWQRITQNQHGRLNSGVFFKNVISFFEPVHLARNKTRSVLSAVNCMLLTIVPPTPHGKHKNPCTTSVHHRVGVGWNLPICLCSTVLARHVTWHQSGTYVHLDVSPFDRLSVKWKDELHWKGSHNTWSNWNVISVGPSKIKDDISRVFLVFRKITCDTDTWTEQSSIYEEPLQLVVLQAKVETILVRAALAPSLPY